jgi:hypothetical protein
MQFGYGAGIGVGGAPNNDRHRPLLVIRR